MDNSSHDFSDKVLKNTKFQQMTRQKAWFSWGFSAMAFTMYVVFIWIIGKYPFLLAQPVHANGVTTWGIYIGMFVIVFSVVMTTIYVFFANGKFEKMTQEVVNTVKGEVS